MKIFLLFLLFVNLTFAGFDVPKFPESFYMKTTGISMGEKSDGQYVFCRKIPYNELRVGMTVMRWDIYRKCIIHHRLIKKNIFGYWIAKGDNNDFEDLPFGEDAYIGVTNPVDIWKENANKNWPIVNGYRIWEFPIKTLTSSKLSDTLLAQ